MNKKFSQVKVLIFEGIIQCIFIILPILLCISNLKWSSWYDADNLIGFAIFNIFPFVITPYVLPIIILPLLYITYKVKNVSGKLVLISIIMFTLLTGAINVILGYQQSPSFDKMLGYTLNIGIIVHSVLLILFIIYSAASCIKNLKKYNTELK